MSPIYLLQTGSHDTGRLRFWTPCKCASNRSSPTIY